MPQDVELEKLILAIHLEVTTAVARESLIMGAILWARAHGFSTDHPFVRDYEQAYKSVYSPEELDVVDFDPVDGDEEVHIDNDGDIRVRSHGWLY